MNKLLKYLEDRQKAREEKKLPPEVLTTGKLIEILSNLNIKHSKTK